MARYRQGYCTRCKPRARRVLIPIKSSSGVRIGEFCSRCIKEIEGGAPVRRPKATKEKP